MKPNKEQNTGIFINGKAQIVEMLQIMGDEERATLIKNLKLRNAPLADELFAKSISFRDLKKLEDEALNSIFSSIQPAILGMALKGVDAKLQKRLLTIVSRDYAEKAYEVMSNLYNNEKELTKKAQNKILEIVARYLRRSVAN